MEDTRNSQTSAPERDDSRSELGDRLLVVELPKLILASTSPRRAEILRTVGWPFESCPVDIDEARRPGEKAAAYVQRLAVEKAQAAAGLRSAGSTIIGADTVVVIDEEILGKPHGEDDARRMLRQLSGQWHQVLTGIALINGARGEIRVAHETTEVKFAAMSHGEIDWYVSSGEPMDKAGAYAIQGLGSRFIEGIRGDYFTVVGLPVRLLYELWTKAAP
jgi:septum formation protein